MGFIFTTFCFLHRHVRHLDVPLFMLRRVKEPKTEEEIQDKGASK